MLHSIQQLQMNPVEDLGWKTIDGIKAKGFNGTIDGVMWTIWANPETGLPVEVEKHVNDGGIVMQMSRFEFDVVFDESLFNTVAPEGYRVQKLTQEKDTPAEPPEFVQHACTQQLEMKGKVRLTQRIEYLTPSIRRQVSPDGRIDIIDMSETDCLQISLYPDTKVASKITMEGFGKRKDPYCLDLLERTRAAHNRIDLGEKRIDERLVYGIKSEITANAFEFWLDKETDQLVQMIIHHLSSKAPRRIICSDFDFETPLDPALFSTDVPKGYTVKSSVQEMHNHELKKPEFIRHSFRQQLELSGVIKNDKRMEYLTPSIRRQIDLDGTIDVVDMSAVDLKTLSLNPEKKSAEKEIVAGFGIHEDPYCLGMMQKTLAQKNHEDLGERMVEGRLAYGIKNDTFEVWIDKETQLPLRLIIQHHNSPEPRRIIMSEFDFTTPLDEALFSTEAPAGYSLKVLRK